MSSGGTPAGRQSLVAAATVSAGCCVVVVIVVLEVALVVDSAFSTVASALATAGSDTAEEKT